MIKQTNYQKTNPETKKQNKRNRKAEEIHADPGTERLANRELHKIQNQKSKNIRKDLEGEGEVEEEGERMRGTKGKRKERRTQKKH